jgi:hypothetical protein
VVEGILRLWEEREVFLDALDRLPQTLCHFDAFRGNLFTRYAADEAEQTVAIDWAFVGRGAVGEEIRPLLSHGLRSGEVGKSRGQELLGIVLEGYLGGLREEGWRADAQQVRLGCGVHDAMRALVTFGQALPVFLDESLYTWAEQALGRSIEEIADSAAERRRKPLLDWVGEARALLGLA